MLTDKEKITLNVLKTMDETDKIYGILKCLSKYYCPFKNKEMRTLIEVLFEKNHKIKKQLSEAAEILDKNLGTQVG